MSAVPPILVGALDHVQQAASATFLSLNSTFSLASLASALGLAAFAVAAGRLRRRGRLSVRLLLKALQPRGAVLGASGKADLGFFLLNTFSTGGLIGWGLISQGQVSAWTLSGLTAALGVSRAHAVGFPAAFLTTLGVFLAYDLAYWIDHWLSHRLPFLWELHKVHHTAEALSPLTNFRVHPLETLHFYNLAALFTGAAHGALAYALGPRAGHWTLLGADAGVVLFTFTLEHLQHTHIWISFTGWLGRVLLSPAHHQIHHSTDARHFGCNLGSALAIWDWLFGTLYVPAATREPLRFGVSDATEAAHTVTGGLITPIVDAARTLAPPDRTDARPSVLAR